MVLFQPIETNGHISGELLWCHWHFLVHSYCSSIQNSHAQKKRTGLGQVSLSFIIETGYFWYCCSLANFGTCVTWEDALYLSFNVFNTQLIVEYTILTSPTGDWIRAISSWSYEPLNGPAIHKAAKALSAIRSYFKTEYLSALGTEPPPPILPSSAVPTRLILQRYIYN